MEKPQRQKILLQEAINKYCYESGKRETVVRRELKNALFPTSSAANKDQFLNAVINNVRQSLRPHEYNIVCRVLNCTSDDLNGTHLKK